MEQPNPRVQSARDCGRSEALEVVASDTLPAGWTGKLWAVEQGIQHAKRLRPRFLLLTDADIRHSADNIAKLVAIAEAGNYDLASFMVKLHCQSLAERFLIPPFVFFFFLLYPPAWIRDPRHNVAGAAGGCMLIRPEALERAGGISAIRNQIIDDCALARAVKRSGGRVWLGVTPDAESTRVYGSFSEIERMVARTAFNQLQHSAWMLTGRDGWTDDHLSAPDCAAFERQRDSGGDWSGKLAADVRRISSDGAILRAEPGVGSDPAI